MSAEEIRESKSLPCVEWLRVSPIASFVTRTTNYCTKLRKQYEEEAERYKEDDFLYQASQQYEEEAERHLVERYQHMQDEDFGLDRLMEEAERHLVERYPHMHTLAGHSTIWSPH